MNRTLVPRWPLKLIYSHGLSNKRGILTDNSFFKISPEVRDAVLGGRPVVALETTIYTHGFPYPENIALSEHLEQTVRDHGAIPATIGVLNGIIRVGMSGSESRELLETSRQPTTIKLSRRDISYIAGLGLSGRLLNGGTTIASTMVLSHLAGIKVFATGGLGGVHRGGENSMDISADLTELGRTPVAVISSGCKSFLDIPRTLEYLETQGAGVATFADGREGPVDFPAFWTRDSGIRSPKTILNEKEAAAIIYTQSKLNIQSGLLFASPIHEQYSLSKPIMDTIIAEAIAEATNQGASGSDNTPFVLDYIHRTTKNGSINANRKLIENNVIRGAKVSVALANLEKGDEYQSSFMPQAQPVTSRSSSTEEVDVIVAGSLAVDLSCNYEPIAESTVAPMLHTSNPASISQSLGGVGHNVATAIHYAGSRVKLCAPVGNDLAGKAATAALEQRGLDVTGLKILGESTATPQYIAVNDQQKNLFVAMADMRILEGAEDVLQNHWPNELAISKPQWLVVDANWSSNLIRAWVKAGRAAGAKIALEPVSVQKSMRLFYKTWRDQMAEYIKGSPPFWNATEYLADLVTPNQAELAAMAQHTRPEAAWPSLISRLDKSLVELISPQLKKYAKPVVDAVILLSNFNCILTKLGPEGVLHAEILLDGDTRLTNAEHIQHIILRRADVLPNQDSIQVLPPIDSQSNIAQVAGVYVRHYPAAEQVNQTDIISVNGVGDTFLGVLVAGLLQNKGKDISELIGVSQQASILTLKDSSAVSLKIKGILDQNHVSGG